MEAQPLSSVSNTPHRPARRFRRRAAATAVAMASLSVGMVLGIAEPASALVTYSNTAGVVNATVSGSGAVPIACVSGMTTVGGGTGSPAIPCNALTGVIISGDSGAQTIDGTQLESAAFTKKPGLTANLNGGNDLVYESARKDNIYLGGGDDNLYLRFGVANTALDMGADTDTVRFYGDNTAESVVVSSENISTTFNRSSGGGPVATAQVYYPESVEVATYAGDDTIDMSGIVASSSVKKGSIFAGDGNDTVRGPQVPAYLEGGSGNNLIMGGSGKDNISSNGNGDVIDLFSGGGDMVNDRTSPQSGRTIQKANSGGFWYAFEGGSGDTQTRIRPIPTGGATVTNSLTRPGFQPLGATFSTVQASLMANASVKDSKGLVDVVALKDQQTVYLRGDQNDNDLLDITIPTGSWTTMGSPGETYWITPSAPGYKPIQASNFGQAKVHGPWVNKSNGFVHRVTRDLMFRFATDQAISVQGLSLTNGATTRADIIDGLMDTDEYRGLDVDRVFTKYLRRASDAGGRTYWINSIRNGKALWRFRAQLFGSNEYFTKAGGTNAAYMVKAYEDVLGRKPDPSGQAYWTAKLDGGADRGSVALQFINSPEARRRVVDDQWLRFLGTKPTTEQQTTWVDKLPTATGEQELIAYLAATDGYFNAA